MKFAVIADVHGNAPALRAVLRQLDQRQDIEQIYCLGDMIGIGPDTNEVLDRLFTRNDVSMITGNHDEAILALLNEEQHPLSHSHAKEHHQWIADRIDPRFISKLEELPRTIHLTIEGKSILFTHYHIEPTKFMDPISEDPFSKIVEPTMDNMLSLFKGHKEDFIGFGHHHPLHFFESEKTTFLNPGSLGCQSTSFAPYSIVDIDKKKIVVHLEEAAYDKTRFLASYDQLKVPERELLMRIFHGHPK